MAVIALEGMEFFSYHGHFEEESVIGTKFIIDLHFETDTSKAEESDELEDTVNYQEVYLTIKEQMRESSKLIEHVARRTLNVLMEKYPEIESASLKLRKINPPLGGLLESVSIKIEA
jgi:dihydroneopterin aldolase